MHVYLLRSGKRTRSVSDLVLFEADAFQNLLHKSTYRLTPNIIGTSLQFNNIHVKSMSVIYSGNTIGKYNNSPGYTKVNETIQHVDGSVSTVIANLKIHARISLILIYFSVLSN